MSLPCHENRRRVVACSALLGDTGLEPRVDRSERRGLVGAGGVPIYYVECGNTPPPFAALLENGIGYLTPDGRAVLYGPREPQPMRTRGWPDGDYIPGKPLSAPTPKTPKLRLGICGICGAHVKLTRHHLTPRQIVNAGLSAKKQGIVRICWPCHCHIHRLFTNTELANTHWPDVAESVRAAGVRSGESKGESQSGACSPSDPELSDGGRDR